MSQSQLYEWIQANFLRLPMGKQGEIRSIKFNNTPTTLVFKDGIWYWDESQPNKTPVHESSWPTIEWLSPVSTQEKDFISQQHSPDGASVATLPCTVGNNIQQLREFTNKFINYWYAGQMNVTIQGFDEWIKTPEGKEQLALLTSPASKKDIEVYVPVEIKEGDESTLPNDDGYYIVKSTAGLTREWYHKKDKSFGTNPHYRVLASHWLKKVKLSELLTCTDSKK